MTLAKYIISTFTFSYQLPLDILHSSLLFENNVVVEIIYILYSFDPSLIVGSMMGTEKIFTSHSMHTTISLKLHYPLHQIKGAGSEW